MGKSFQQRLDGFVNTLTGLGGAKDKRLAAQFLPATQLDDATLDNLYNFNDLAHTVVSIYPEEALRQGYEINIEGDKEGDKAQKVQARADDLGLNTSALEGACWGRLFGGGAILLGFDDRQKQDTPLKEDKGGKLLFLRVLDKTELQVDQYYQDPLKSDFGRPEVYRYTPTTMRGGVDPNTLIHESRLVMFPGAHTTKKQKQRNNGWDQSVLQAVYDVIRDFEAGFAGAGYLLNEASQAVYGVKGLLEILAGEGGQETLSKRMEIVEMSRSVARALLIDADGETFERKPVSFTGIPDVLDRLCSRLSAATGIPVTILMGQAPAGLNATGASDIRAFYDRVKSYQKDVIKPALERVLRIIMISEFGSEPESWDIKFNSLYQPTDLEVADLRQKVSATDTAYITAGVLTPEEVATNRFTPTGWSMETQIDLDLRREVDEANAQKIVEQAKNPDTVAGDPATLVPEKEPVAPKKDAFDPDQPRDEQGRWGSGGGPSSKEKWAKAREYVAQKKAAQKPQPATGSKVDLNAPGKVAEETAVNLATGTAPPKEGYEDLAFISDVYETAKSKGFTGTLAQFKEKLPMGALARADIVSALDEEKVRKSETNVKFGNIGEVQRHFVRRRMDDVESDSERVDVAGEVAGPDPEETKSEPRTN